MKKYIVDGNNLIGKISLTSKLQKKDKQAAREKLAHLIERYFSGKSVRVIINFDGYANKKINISKAVIIYSDGQQADAKIKAQIEEESNKRNIVLVSSDNNLREFAKVCGCTIMLSEDFAKAVLKVNKANDEEVKIQEINDPEVFKKIFNVK